MAQHTSNTRSKCSSMLPGGTTDSYPGHGELGNRAHPGLPGAA